LELAPEWRQAFCSASETQKYTAPSSVRSIVRGKPTIMIAEKAADHILGRTPAAAITMA
jgi:hypothetical protein